MRRNSEITTSNHIDLGYVEAGDTLTISFTNTIFSNVINDFTEGFEFSGLDRIALFSEDEENLVRFIPVVEEDTTAEPFVEFKLRSDTNFIEPGQSIIVSPNLAFSNGNILYPEKIFNLLAMEIYDGTDEFGYFVSDPFSPFPVRETIVFPTTDGEFGSKQFPLFAHNDSTNIGQNIKIRIAGEIIASPALSKVNPDNEGLLLSNIPGDENCGIDPETLVVGQFINCFEIPIGNITTSELLVAVQPDSIAPGDSVSFDVKLKTQEGDTISFPTDQLFDIGLDDASKSLGTLLNSQTEDTADVLVDVRQGFQFISRELITDTVNVTGVVTTAIGNNSEIISSLFEIIITPSFELTIELPDSAQVWPTIPRTGARPEFDFTQVENVLEDVVVRLTSNGEPLIESRVSIRAEWIEGSGGHNHNEDNDLLSPPLNELGYIVDIAESDSARGEIDGITNSLGEIELRYRAPIFGGEVELMAKYPIGTDTLIARDTIIVEVPDLVLLPDGENYSKVGGRGSHHGPRVDGGFPNNRVPDNNHYVTEDFRDSLVSLADLWTEFILEDSLQDNRQTPLNFNDISLPKGGLFDIFGNWRNPHRYHRVGRDIDIRTTRNLPIGNNRNGILLTQITDQNGQPIIDASGNEVYRSRAFERYLRLVEADGNSGIHGTGNNEHYHIYFYD